MQIKTCSAFGHREVFENISERITIAVMRAVDQGCGIFYTGSMGEFDDLFSATVRKVQKDYPYIKLICVKPYQTKELNENNDYYSDIVLIYTIRSYGGAFEAEKYSIKKQKSIIYIRSVDRAT